MIPLFPKFKKLELSDRGEVGEITSKYPPYSDFNFVSMYSWDTKGEMELSILNNNLVVKFTDYINGQPFFSFLGDNMVNETVGELLKYSCDLGLPCELRLVPEDSIKGLDQNKYKISEDRDNFDYVLNVKKTMELNGGEYKSKRREIKDLVNNKNVYIKPLGSIDEVSAFLSKLHVLEGEIKLNNEDQAIHRLFTLEKKSDIILLGMYEEDELLGFVINEISPNHKYSVGHFLKVNSKSRNGLSAYLLKKVSEALSAEGVEMMNMEQDLGIIGLRKWKLNNKPVGFLKKYKISP